MKRLEDLCNLARTETPPLPDVEQAVMAWVQSESSATLQLIQRPMWWCAGVIATAAMVAMICALIQARIGADPLGEVVDSILWVVQ